MSTNAAFSTDAPQSVPAGDEFSPEEIAILKGETPPEAVPSSPTPDTPAPEAANDDIDAEEIATEDVVFDENGNARSKENGRFVPKSAYLRVKEESRSKDQKLAAVAAELIRQRERQATLAEMYAAARPETAQPAPEQIPDPETDLFAYVKWQQKEIERLKAETGQENAATRQRLEAMQLQTAARTDLESFAAREPSFMEAFGYLQGQRHQELEALGVADPAQREHIIKQEARELIQGALSSQTSAAERIWKLAQARGYKPKPKDAPPIDPNAAAQIERINKGKEASATLRGTGTTADTGQPLTLNKLIDMSEAEYLRTRDVYVKQHGKAAWERLTSGR